MMKRILLISFFTVLIAVASFSPVHADSERPWKRLSVSLGGFFTDIDTKVRQDSKTTGTGTEINVEDELGVDSSTTVFRADAFWRFFRRHRFDFSYYDLQRDARAALDSDIDFGDVQFPAGTAVESVYNIRVFKGVYTFSFIQNQRFDVGASLGVHLTDVELGITAAGLREEDVDDFLAPLPVVGLRGAYAITPKFFLKASVDYFFIEIDSFEGRLIDANVSLEYNLFKYVGAGIGYNYFNLDVDIDTSDYLGNTELEYQGFQFFVKFYY
jgi:hypothetical protein